MRLLLLLLACFVIYLSVGRGLLALYGWRTGEPFGRRAIRAAAGGRGAQSTVSTTRYYFDVMVTLVWLAILVAWPGFFALQLAAWVARRRKSQHTVGGKNWSITIGAADKSRD
ncbi:hypothetical protein [Streptomyces sp. NPDC059783]|uniref:hypothetical protein n=1 Tax=Streptomyces sp. NPDC059783 TaxID=3346944 RepID=UPI00365995AD